jgi:hypothetical protein
MDVTAAANSLNALAGLASDLRSAQVQSQIGVAILKQQQDAQQRQAEALLAMMRQAEAFARGGVDVYA